MHGLYKMTKELASGLAVLKSEQTFSGKTYDNAERQRGTRNNPVP